MIAGVNTSNLAAKSDLVCLKPKVGNLDIDKLKTVPADLIKLINVADNTFLKNTVSDQLVSKVNALDSSILVEK